MRKRALTDSCRPKQKFQIFSTKSHSLYPLSQIFQKKFNCTMSLQDHRMQIYHNILRKTKFMKNVKFHKYSVYRHPITCYTPPCKWEVNWIIRS